MKLSHSLSISAAIGALLTHAAPVLEPRLLPSQPVAAGFSDPNSDPFYVAPSNISAYKAGQVVRQRSTVSTFKDNTNLDHSYQVMMRSENTQNQAIGGVATILVPKKVAAGAPKILSYQNFEDAVSLSCSPSWAYVDSSNSTAKLAANIEAPFYVNWALTQGYYVVIPDQEGPTNSFIAGRTEGKIVLDGIRAIVNNEKLSNSQAALFGYSGGAHATVWATELHESYASDVNIIGAVHGGTPIDPEHLLNFLNGGAFSGFAGAGLIGVMSQHPDLYKFVHDHLNADGQALLEKAVQPNVCIGEIVTEFAFVDYFKYINVSNPLQDPVAQKVLKEETLLQKKASYEISVPKFPRYLYHALADEIVPYNDSQQYVKDQCAGGANIQFVTLPLAEHVTGEVEGIVGAIQYLGQLYAGTTPKVACGTAPGLLDLTSQTQTASVMGNDLATKFEKLQASPAQYQGAYGMQPSSDGKSAAPASNLASAMNAAKGIVSTLLGA